MHKHVNIFRTQIAKLFVRGLYLLGYPFSRSTDKGSWQKVYKPENFKMLLGILYYYTMLVFV